MEVRKQQSTQRNTVKRYRTVVETLLSQPLPSMVSKYHENPHWLTWGDINMYLQAMFTKMKVTVTHITIQLPLSSLSSPNNPSVPLMTLGSPSHQLKSTSSQHGAGSLDVYIPKLYLLSLRQTGFGFGLFFFDIKVPSVSVFLRSPLAANANSKSERERDRHTERDIVSKRGTVSRKVIMWNGKSLSLPSAYRKTLTVKDDVAMLLLAHRVLRHVRSKMNRDRNEGLFASGSTSIQSIQCSIKESNLRYLLEHPPLFTQSSSASSHSGHARLDVPCLHCRQLSKPHPSAQSVNISVHTETLLSCSNGFVKLALEDGGMVTVSLADAVYCELPLSNNLNQHRFDSATLDPNRFSNISNNDVCRWITVNRLSVDVEPTTECFENELKKTVIRLELNRISYSTSKEPDEHGAIDRLLTRRTVSVTDVTAKLISSVLSHDIRNQRRTGSQFSTNGNGDALESYALVSFSNQQPQFSTESLTAEINGRPLQDHESGGIASLATWLELDPGCHPYTILKSFKNRFNTNQALIRQSTPQFFFCNLTSAENKTSANVSLRHVVMCCSDNVGILTRATTTLLNTVNRLEPLPQTQAARPGEPKPVTSVTFSSTEPSVSVDAQPPKRFSYELMISVDLVQCCLMPLQVADVPTILDALTNQTAFSMNQLHHEQTLLLSSSLLLCCENLRLSNEIVSSAVQEPDVESVQLSARFGFALYSLSVYSSGRHSLLSFPFAPHIGIWPVDFSISIQSRTKSPLSSLPSISTICNILSHEKTVLRLRLTVDQLDFGLISLSRSLSSRSPQQIVPSTLMCVHVIKSQLNLHNMNRASKYDRIKSTVDSNLVCSDYCLALDIPTIELDIASSVANLPIYSCERLLSPPYRTCSFIVCDSSGLFLDESTFPNGRYPSISIQMSGLGCRASVSLTHRTQDDVPLHMVLLDSRAELQQLRLKWTDDKLTPLDGNTLVSVSTLRNSFKNTHKDTAGNIHAATVAMTLGSVVMEMNAVDTTHCIESMVELVRYIRLATVPLEQMNIPQRSRSLSALSCKPSSTFSFVSSSSSLSLAYSSSCSDLDRIGSPVAVSTVDIPPAYRSSLFRFEPPAIDSWIFKLGSFKINCSDIFHEYSPITSVLCLMSLNIHELETVLHFTSAEAWYIDGSAGVVCSVLEPPPVEPGSPIATEAGPRTCQLLSLQHAAVVVSQTVEDKTVLRNGVVTISHQPVQMRITSESMKVLNTVLSTMHKIGHSVQQAVHSLGTDLQSTQAPSSDLGLPTQPVPQRPSSSTVTTSLIVSLPQLDLHLFPDRADSIQLSLSELNVCLVKAVPDDRCVHVKLHKLTVSLETNGVLHVLLRPLDNSYSGPMLRCMWNTNMMEKDSVTHVVVNVVPLFMNLYKDYLGRAQNVLSQMTITSESTVRSAPSVDIIVEQPRKSATQTSLSVSPLLCAVILSPSTEPVQLSETWRFTCDPIAVDSTSQGPWKDITVSVANHYACQILGQSVSHIGISVVSRLNRFVLWLGSLLGRSTNLSVQTQ
eukprot:GILJ01012824.1.p1 GENE.GILJ01012824.1~~GILJ01012824.1.p1  ORF type:complete len:1643 (-),score=225.82 GILJ01012824.1:87-4631(-)